MKQGELLDSPGPGALVRVALNRPMREEYTYFVPPGTEPAPQVGMRVAVSFAGRREVGIVTELPEETDVPASRLKPLSAVLDDEPVLDAQLLKLTRFMASYYACSWGEALSAVLPAVLKREGGRRKVVQLRPAEGVGAEQLAQLEDKHEAQFRVLRTLLEASGPLERSDLLRRLNVSPSPVQTLEKKGWIVAELVETGLDELLAAPAAQRSKPAQLTPEQEVAVGALTARVREGGFEAFLLRGVTGSGKTEVYLSVIEEVLAAGRGAIVLVPEIALTPQTVGWFRGRFGQVAVLHSRMTDAQRHDAWRMIRRGEARVVVGARSALFAPMPDLGIVIVDEEHEPSFKQGSTPRYHARDMAVLRARDAEAVCVLGSATPSLESWENARQGRYTLLTMDKRVHGGQLPSVEVVDLRVEKAEGPFSGPLELALKGVLERGEQAILFQNRRGFAPVLWCRACRMAVRCAQCDSSLVFHKRHQRVVCHSCCEEQHIPSACPSCTAPGLRFLGDGSERVEEAVLARFPAARVARMDSDTMHRREDYEEVLGAFGRGDLDVLVGTQMIAKGLDFPRVTLVGIISADGSLHLPDLRASERTFQLLSQVAGRAGRGELAGRILIQTHTPDHPAIVQAARHDYLTFASGEMELRQELSYPPFGRLARVLLEDEDSARVEQAGANLAAILQEHLDPAEALVLGPAPAPMALVRGRHRAHLLIKAPGRGEGLAPARGILQAFAERNPRPRVTIDIDPVSML